MEGVDENLSIPAFIMDKVRQTLYKYGDFYGSIGKGSSGFVHLVRDRKDHQIYAVKIVFNYAKIEQANNEIYIPYTLHHKNLIKIYEHSIIGYKSKSVFLIKMEYCAGGNVGQLIQRYNSDTKYGPVMPEIVAKHIAIPIVQAMNLIHTRPAVHRDIKPDNIFLRYVFNIENPSDPIDVVLGDFGFAKELTNEDRSTSTTCGTVSYIAPEILSNIGKCESERVSYKTSVDIWSFGVTLYHMVFGCLPFGKLNSCPDEIEKLIYEYRINPNIIFEGKEASDGLKDVIRACLNPDPEKRVSADQLCTFSWLCEEPCFDKNQSLDCFSFNLDNSFEDDYCFNEFIDPYV